MYKAIPGTAVLAVLLILACSPEKTDVAPLSGPLPAPRTHGGMPLMDALKNRATTREFSERALPRPVLSDLLWAAFGVNRPDGKRTAPSAFNIQSVDIYLAVPEGVFLCGAKEHSLKPMLDEDVRPLACGQGAFSAAPASLMYIADLSRYPEKMSGEDRIMWARYDTGFIGQNVYLFCASEKLAAVIHPAPGDSLAKRLGLSPSQKVLLVQTVGYPKEKDGRKDTKAEGTK